MIFPLVIAAVAAVIYMVIGLYSSLSIQTSLHMDLRRESGELTQTVIRLEHIRDFESTKGLRGIRPVVRMKAGREYRIGSLFRQNIYKTEYGSSYIIDESELIRILSMGGTGT